MKTSLILLASLLISACSSSTQPTTTQANNTGVLFGRVVLQDPNGKQLPSSAGTVITAVNKGLSTTTNDAGYWWLANAPAGVYHLLGTHHNYATKDWTPFQFVGADTLVFDSTLALYRPYFGKIVFDSIHFDSSTVTVAVRPIILDTLKVYSIYPVLYVSLDSNLLVTSRFKLPYQYTIALSAPYMAEIPHLDYAPKNAPGSPGRKPRS